MFKAIKEALGLHQKFLVTTHLQPDGDGLGASKALIELIRFFGKDVYFFSPSPIPEKFSFLGLNDCSLNSIEEVEKFEPDVLFVLDAHKKERIGELGTHNFKTFCIDHHEGATSFEEGSVMDPKACSTGALVYSLCKECGFELTQASAVGLYVSVLCDTGRFSNSSTSRKAHKIANECIKVGVNPDAIFSKLYESIRISEFLKFNQALSSIQFFFQNKVALERLLKESHEEELDLEWLHELNKKIVEVECSVILQEISAENVRVSLRSKAFVDCLKIAKEFGGGGHKKAAGATFKGKIDDAKAKVVALLEGQLVQ